MGMRYVEIELPPAGLQPAVLAEVSLVIKENQEWDEKNHKFVTVMKNGQPEMVEKVIYSFELDAKRKDGKPFIMFKEFYANISATNNHGKFLASWSNKAGQKLTREEIQQWIDFLENDSTVKSSNANCVLKIEHRTSQGRGNEYAMISDINPKMTGQSLKISSDYVPYSERIKRDDEGTQSPAAPAIPTGKPDIPF